MRPKDEFGELAENLNKMSANLQETLEKLERANIRLEKDVQQERKLFSKKETSSSKGSRIEIRYETIKAIPAVFVL